MILCYQMSMKKLASVLYLASFALGSFCPISMAAAMKPAHMAEHESIVQEVPMSPYMPMTLIAPMSVAAVTHHVSTSMGQMPGNCPGGSCFMAHHSQEKEAVVTAGSTHAQEIATLPAVFPPPADSFFALSPPLLYRGGSHLSNTIATIVLRV